MFGIMRDSNRRRQEEDRDAERRRQQTQQARREAERERLCQAFLAGAKYWEWRKEGATMWQSDQAEVYEEARKKDWDAYFEKLRSVFDVRC